jgi:PAS domain-containing protein
MIEKLHGIIDVTVLKIAGLLAALSIIWKPLKGFWLLISKAKDRIDKIDEIHKQVTADGGLNKKFEELHALVKKVEHIESLLHVNFNHMEIPVFICDLDGRNIFVNNAYCDMVQMDREELLGYGWKDYFDSKDYDHHWKRMHQELRRVEFTIKNIRIQSQPIILMDGSHGYFGTLKPI